MNQIIGEFIESSLKNQWCPTRVTKQFDVFESDWPFLQIDFEDDFKKMHEECIQNDHLFVGHRQKDKHLSYSHEGWGALTLHGIRPDATEHYDQYGLSEPDYNWTEVCELFPTCTKFLKKLGYRSYDRVRIMRLAPGGYIMPHADGKGRIFGPLNIAINNPDGCGFYFDKWGKVPFKQGTGFFLDIGNVHAVYNNSDEPRYHFIVHGDINEKLITKALNQIPKKEYHQSYSKIKPINKITIVGGGTSGWLTAAYLLKNLKFDCEIVLIEKKESESVGVGEATIPGFREFMEGCGFSVEDWFEPIEATFKSGALFTDWQKEGSDLWNPFAFPSFETLQTNLLNLWTKNKDLDYFTYACSSYNINVNDNKIDPFNIENYAYHVNCSKLVQFIKSKIIDKITYLSCEVQKVNRNSKDGVESIVLDTGESIQSDLYVDCTGWKRLLGSKPDTVDCSDRLFCDTAVTGHIPYENIETEMVPYTNCCAVDHGWIWKIPTQSRIGSGLVFNREITSLEEAKKYFVKYWNNRIDIDSLKVLDWTPFYHKNFWQDNVVCVGLSAGFIEPLESTGIALICVGICEISEALTECNYTDLNVEVFNLKLKCVFEEAIDYVNMHYSHNKREHGKFWKFVQDNFNFTDVQKYYENETLNNPYTLPTDGDYSSQLIGGDSSSLYRGENWSMFMCQLLDKQLIEPKQDGLSKDQSRSLIINFYNNQIKKYSKFILHSDFIKGVKLPDSNQKTICYGVYNQRKSINNFSMYLRSKGATLFYLNRINKDLKIICRDEIHEILQEALDCGYGYCVVQSSGCTLKSFNFDEEIADFIENNNFGIAGHILNWPGKWLELHPQFFIVNVSAWESVGCPEFGDWYSEEQMLPVIERSVENFHDDYTPIWVKYSGREEMQPNSGRGWNILRSMLVNNFPVITLSEKLRLNKFYYYPECDTEKFEDSIKTLTPYEGQNWNQKTMLSEVKSVKDQIWLFNSETMDITNGGSFDLVANTASGFKLLDIFRNGKLNENGKVIVYDFNVKSLQWYKHFHSWKNTNLVDCIRSFSQKDHFTWSGKTSNEYFEDGSFVGLYNDLMNYFGGPKNFGRYWRLFKKTPTKFVVVDLYQEPEKFANIFVGKGRKFINLSNIFSTDATTIIYGHNEVQSCQQKCLSSLYVVDPEIQISIFDFWNRHLVGKIGDIL